MTAALTVQHSLSAPASAPPASLQRCHEIWTQLTRSLAAHNLSVNYTYRPAHLQQVLTFTVPEVNQSISCVVSRLPFKPIAFSFLLAVIAVSFVGNVSLFASLLSSRTRLSRVDFFILHLSVADIIVLLTPLVEVINIASRSWYGGRYICKLYRVLSIFGLYLSSYIVVSIAVDRHFAIARPLSIATAGRRGRLLLLLSFSASVLCSLPQALIFDVYESSFFKSYNKVCMEKFAADKSSSHVRKLYNMFAFLMMYGLPVIVVFCCYCRIVWVLTLKTKEHRDSRHPGASGAAAISTDESAISLRRTDVTNIQRARMRALKLTVIIVLAFLLCWAPYWVVTMLNAFEAGNWLSMRDSDATYICLTFAFFNSALNPLVYGAFTKPCSEMRRPWLPSQRRRQQQQQQQLLQQQQQQQ